MVETRAYVYYMVHGLGLIVVYRVILWVLSAICLIVVLLLMRLV
jgi:hypothetical protein